MKKILLHGKLATLAILIILIGACASNPFEQSYKMLTVSKGVLETAGKTAKRFCEQGLLNEVDCAKAKDYYTKAQKSHNLAVENVIQTLNSGEDPRHTEAWKQYLRVYGNMSTALITILQDNGVIESPNELKPEGE